MKQVKVLGVKIDDVSLTEALSIVEKWGTEHKKQFIVTPNPEFLVAAQSDLEFKKILNQADLAIPDGVGLKLSGDIVNTTSGIDLMEAIIKVSNDWGVTVGFLGGQNGVAKKTAECLKKTYPKIKITIASDGPMIDLDGNEIINDHLKIPKTDILFVGFGQIKQEKWISKNLGVLPVKIMMGVGGSFDYLSGSVPRAPKFLRNLGLEWLFRLVIQPWRIKRQLALIKFIWLILKSKI